MDLAGSERAEATGSGTCIAPNTLYLVPNYAGATGDRLKEGSAINQSLLTLGRLISDRVVVLSSLDCRERDLCTGRPAGRQEECLIHDNVLKSFAVFCFWNVDTSVSLQF